MRRFGLLAMLAMARAARGGTLGDLLQQRDLDDGSTASEAGARFALPAGIGFEADLAYGSDPAQRVDVYRPARAEGAPVIVMVHGGGWRRGDKGGPSMVKNKVLHWVGGKGCVLVSVNYRVVPAANPAQQAEDVGRALAFVQGRARQWGADPARLVLIGHSAGAHLVSLIAADPSLVTRAGGQGWLATIPIDSAAFDVEAIMNRRHYGLYDTAFGSEPALWREASPIQRLKGRPATPMLLVCSSRRSDSCPPAQAFAAKANSLGGRVRLLPVELNHLQLNDQLGAGGPYTAAVDEFLAEFGIR